MKAPVTTQMAPCGERTHLSAIVVALGLLWPTVSFAQESAFGSQEKSDGTLLGIFYDLKQNQKRQPLPSNIDHLKTLGEFVDSGWDENVLSRFFRGTRPIYATQVFIPTIGADTAPAAFGLAGVVKPSQWFVIYKAQVSPPEDGTWRFVGVADDVMAVGVNGKTVLVSNFGAHRNYSRWTEPAPNEAVKVWAGTLKRGNWFTCRKGEIIDLDILIGEIPGNLFGAWLMIEKQGRTYPSVQDPKYGAQPVLPLFQVKKKTVANPGGPQSIPFSSGGEPWVCEP
jgi:hypothetical protein